jgi:hypothetical protein
MTSKIESNALTFNDIYGARCIYNMPVFQRNYVWGKDSIDRFLEDLEDIDLTKERDRHFLGPVIVTQKKAGGAARHTENWVIDGQQRLTTAYLTLAALAALGVEHGAFFRDVLSYLFHETTSNRLRPLLVTGADDSSQLREAFEKLPEDVFVRIDMSFRPGNKEGKLFEAFSRIYSRFKKQIKAEADLLKEKGVPGGANPRHIASEKVLKDRFSALLERMLVVFIELTKDEDPKQIFDTLNSAGEALTDVDLIRNEVFSRVEGDDAQFSVAWRLRETLWQPLEGKLGDEFEGYIFPHALTKNHNVKKSKVYSELCEIWKGLTPEEVIKKLGRHADIYLAIKGLRAGKEKNSPFKVSPSDLSGEDEVKLRLHRLRRMGSGLPASAYPFIFSIYEAFTDGNLEKTKFIKCLDLVEAFLVRRALLGIEPTGLHAVFKSMWEKTKGDPSEFLKVIAENKTVQLPTIEEFETAIKCEALYGRSMANYIVFEYEKSFTGGDSIPEEYDIKNNMSLDHVMPQTPTSFAAWGISPEQHKKLLHTWANLVPLTPPANAEKGNMDWDETRKFYDRKSIFKSTRDLAAAYQVWTESELLARSKVLTAWAVNRWKI